MKEITGCEQTAKTLTDFFFLSAGSESVSGLPNVAFQYYENKNNDYIPRYLTPFPIETNSVFNGDKYFN